MQVVSNKKDMAQVFSKIQKHYGEEFSFTPMTFSLSSETEALQQYMD